MNILLLGATGFTGKHLLDILLKREDVSITATIHRTGPTATHKSLTYVQKGLQEIDLAFLKAGDFDYIFHFARIPGKRFGNWGRYAAGRQGYAANKRLLNNIAKLAKQPKIIYMSGSLVYGHNPGREVGEDAPPRPAGFAKFYFAAEQPFLEALQNKTANVIMLRAPWILGGESWFRQLYLSHILRHGEVPIYGNADRSMSIISVEDCAGMAWHYAQNAAPGIYNIYTFASVPYRSFTREISALLGDLPVRQYSEAECRKMFDSTASDAICCEVVLTTGNEQLMASYQPIHGDLPNYLGTLLVETKQSLQATTYQEKVGRYFDLFSKRHLDKGVANPILTDMRNSFRSHITHPHPKNILDIGCGPGQDVAYFAHRYPEAHVYGVDVSAGMIACGEALTKADGLLNVSFINTGVEDLERHLNGDLKFDVISVFFGALNTVASLEESAKVIERLLAPGGQAMLTFVNKYYMAEFFINMAKGRIKKATSRWGKKWPGYSPEVMLESNTYTPAQITKAFSGLTLNKKRGYSIFYPAWFQAHWLKRFPRLCRILHKVDNKINRTPLWQYGEYTLFVYVK